MTKSGDKIFSLAQILIKHNEKDLLELTPEERSMFLSRTEIVLDKLRKRKLLEGGPKPDYSKIKTEFPKLYEEFKDFIESNTLDLVPSKEEELLFKTMSHRLRYLSFASMLVVALIVGDISMIYGNLWAPFVVLLVCLILGQALFSALTHPLKYD